MVKLNGKRQSLRSDCRLNNMFQTAKLLLAESKTEKKMITRDGSTYQKS